MRQTLAPFITLFIALALPAASVAAPAMQPGLWEITTTTEMSNVPMKIPPQTFRHCLKKEDLADSRKAIPADKSCKLEDVKESGNSMSWKARCKMDMGEMKGAGQMTLKDQSYQGSMTMTTTMEGMSFDMKHTYAGKRLGNCP